MPTISGHVYYDNSNLFTPGTGIANVPVALFNPIGLMGAVALTDAAGAFSFINVPNGNYQLIETWGTGGGIATPVDFATSALPMLLAPTEAEPPLSALSVVPPVLADRLQALTPNLLNITVAGINILNQNFFDGPVGDNPLILTGVSMVGPNLITAASNGTWGSNPPGTLGNTRPAVDPYPGVVPGFSYSTALFPSDGQFTVTNTSIGWANGPWWVTSDHTIGLETGRFQMVNGANPGNAFFTQPVSVTPNTNYALASWVMNLINFNGAAAPQLGIEVLDGNGNILFSQSVNSIPNQPLPMWFQSGFIFNSGANSSVTVKLISLGPLATGNDYAIDDITMYEVQNLLTQNKSFTPSTVYSQTGVGETAAISVTVTNPTGQSINNVSFQDTIDPNLTFVAGSVTVDNVPNLTANPNAGFTLGTLAPGQSVVIKFQVTTNTGPITIPNNATISFNALTSSTGDIFNASFPTNTANLNVVVNNAVVSTTKTVDKAFAKAGDLLTYTLLLNNSGNVPANNVVITDAIPAGTTYVPGSVTGATGTPPTLTLTNPIPIGGNATITFQVQVGATIPIPNPIPNSASTAYTYTVDPANPNGASGNSDSNTVSTQINSAIITATKTADPAFANVGDTITYTIILANTGNVTANNAVLTDVIPSGTTFVPGSLVGATGTPPTLTLANPVPAGGMATVTFQVLIGNSLPNPNPLANSVTAVFNYTVDPANPNSESGTVIAGPANTQVNTAKLVMTKSANKFISYIGDIITYQLAVQNTGNVSANNVVLIDLLPTGVSFVPGSLIVSTAYSGTLTTGLTLSNPIPAGGIVTLSFKAMVDAMPNPNPIANMVNASYVYTVDPASPDAVTATAVSNVVDTIVLRYNFSQQISDLIESVALEQAALAAIANAEGAKIQKMVAMNGVTTQELLCLNKSVSDMMDSLATLEAVLRQKLIAVDCQINENGGTRCM